jgi:transmembrane sensor
MQPDLSTLDRFLTDETFRAWVRAGGLRQPDAYWTQWWHENPAQQPLLREAQNLLLATHLPDEIVSPEATEHFIDQTLAQVRAKDTPVRWLRAGRNPILRRWVAAASVALLVGAAGGWFWLGSNLNSPATTQPLAQTETPTCLTTNTTSQPLSVALPDGSVVVLQPEAELRHPAVFVGPNREVELLGEAFFRISHKPAQPFLVVANGMVTKVLGTSFRIRANAADPTVTVEVKTGRVAVYTQTDLDKARTAEGLSARAVLVMPNQQVVFERQTGQLTHNLVDEPALLTIPEQNRDFTFTEASVADVFATLEAAYGVDIVFDADRLRNCTLTAPLRNEPLFDKLNVICRAIGGRYEVIGPQIVVQGEGCDE